MTTVIREQPYKYFNYSNYYSWYGDHSSESADRSYVNVYRLNWFKTECENDWDCDWGSVDDVGTIDNNGKIYTDMVGSEFNQLNVLDDGKYFYIDDNKFMIYREHKPYIISENELNQIPNIKNRERNTCITAEGWGEPIKIRSINNCSAAENEVNSIWRVPNSNMVYISSIERRRTSQIVDSDMVTPVSHYIINIRMGEIEKESSKETLWDRDSANYFPIADTPYSGAEIVSTSFVAPDQNQIPWLMIKTRWETLLWKWSAQSMSKVICQSMDGEFNTDRLNPAFKMLGTSALGEYVNKKKKPCMGIQLSQ